MFVVPQDLGIFLCHVGIDFHLPKDMVPQTHWPVPHLDKNMKLESHPNPIASLLPNPACRSASLSESHSPRRRTSLAPYLPGVLAPALPSARNPLSYDAFQTQPQGLVAHMADAGLLWRGEGWGRRALSNEIAWDSQR